MKLQRLLVLFIVGSFCLPFVSRGQEDDRSFERMALTGDVKAQTVMGLRCTDLVKSYAWFSIASMRGEKSAFELRSIIQKNMRQQIDMSLQIKKGEDPSLLLRSDEMYQKQINEGEQLAKKLDQEIRANQIAVLRKAEQEKFVGRGKDSLASDVQKALNGDAKAQALVGTWSPSDEVQKYAWLSLAADQGEETAVKPLSIYQKNLTPKQIEEAKKLTQKIDQEIKRNQLVTLPKEVVERVLAEEIVKREQTATLQRAEQEREAARALAERTREGERLAALQRAEQEKEAVRVLAERAREVKKQEREVTEQAQQIEMQKKNERIVEWWSGIITIFILCAVSYAAYRMRRSKIGWGSVIVLFLGICSMIMGVVGFEVKKQVDTAIITRGWLRAAIEKKPQVEYEPVYKTCEADVGDRVSQFIFGVCVTLGGLVWAGKRLGAAQIKLQFQEEIDSAGWMPAVSLHQAFLANEVAAKVKYKGCQVRVYGIVTKIDPMGIELDSCVYCQGPVSGFPRDVLMKLNTGAIVHVSGTCKVRFSRVSLHGCLIQEGQATA
ncbi:MAG: hypothetical protein WC701_07935 [Kiritimatiellales bacterium]|jgi:hypothetical protein